MEEDQQKQEEQQQIQQQPQSHKGILNKTLGEILHTEDEAQKRIMQGMNISPEQFQQMLGRADGNKYMNMTIGELFKSGFIQQAVKQFGHPNQNAPINMPPSSEIPPQLVSEEIEASGDELKRVAEIQNAQVLETDEMGNPTKVMVPVQQKKQSFGEFIKGLFK